MLATLVVIASLALLVLIQQSPSPSKGGADGSASDNSAGLQGEVVDEEGGTIKVPDITGQTEDQARATLEGLGLRLGSRGESINSATIDIDAICYQDPATGSTVNEGAYIDYSVSKGPTIEDFIDALKGKWTGELQMSDSDPILCYGNDADGNPQPLVIDFTSVKHSGEVVADIDVLEHRHDVPSVPQHSDSDDQYRHFEDVTGSISSGNNLFFTINDPGEDNPDNMQIEIRLVFSGSDDLKQMYYDGRLNGYMLEVRQTGEVPSGDGGDRVGVEYKERYLMTPKASSED